MALKNGIKTSAQNAIIIQWFHPQGETSHHDLQHETKKIILQFCICQLFPIRTPRVIERVVNF
jgi:hypothetical protein